MKRAVVTGGAGFIGSHLVDALVQRGSEVLVIDNLHGGRRENLTSAMARGEGRVSLLELDIRDSNVKDEIVRFQPENVFHLGAQINVRVSVKEPTFDAMTNVVGTVNVLEAVVESKAKSFVFASTGGAIYGEQEHYPADENHLVRPECPYGVSKRASELYIEYFSRVAGFAGTALRFANVYGPRQNPKGEAGVVAIFAERILAGKELVVNGSGEQTRDFVYVKDVVKAILRAEQHNTGGFSCFNVGTAKETSLLTLIDEMRGAWSRIKRPADPEFSAVRHGPALPGEQLRSVIAADRIHEAFGWQPEVTLSQGIEETILSFRTDGA